ncbi:hypothetical protein EG329_008538 [Mollisiaceae sp. DMI_Dod_QoI]|nr:hypothetical protein EG329_008538 [Helotiales sp. DMI_Dod_QoI]
MDASFSHIAQGKPKAVEGVSHTDNSNTINDANNTDNGKTTDTNKHPNNPTSAPACPTLPPPPSPTPYKSVWKEMIQHIRMQYHTDAISLSGGDLGLACEIETDLNDNFEKICDDAFDNMQVQPFYEIMTEDLASCYFEELLWSRICGDAPFLGDVRALNEFREWYDSKDVDEANDSEGGAVVDGGGFGDGREERYADGETDSTDGGAQLP